ncbi:MAG: SUMF1/EgtB/PvdO family nonheme iron enzyme [Candidatus Eisenbacteria bacterium]|nr:SUMF1/EgtB/PvdO family nonheme iron enzyme [Candidatus Eisenbacteria bacterium]
MLDSHATARPRGASPPTGGRLEPAEVGLAANAHHFSDVLRERRRSARALARSFCATIPLALFWLVSLTSAPDAQEIWKMRIHRGESWQEHMLAEIDSITFHADPSPVPLVRVPAGTFVMGDGVSTCGMQEHTVTLTRDFFLAQHEITNGEYLLVLQWAYDEGLVTASTSGVWDAIGSDAELLLDLDNDYVEVQFDGGGTFYLRESPSEPAQTAYPDGYDPSRHPVKEATWFGAAAFCNWLSLYLDLPAAYDHESWECHGGDPYGAAGYRLATDAEWEYAAQFDDERLFPWGDEDPDCARANFYAPGGVCIGWTAPPTSHPAAPTALGLAHLAGNLWEWCNDWFVCELGTAPLVDPPGPNAGTHRVCRAGGWGSVDYDLRCGFRAYNAPDGATYAHGFRIARTAP